MRTALLTLTFVALSGACAFAQVSDQQLVANNFPSALRSTETPNAREFSTFVVADLNHSGQLVIVALYSNGVGAQIRVLDRAGNVIASPVLAGLNGRRGALKLIDIDGDGTPEILVYLFAGVGLDLPDSWILRWTSGNLRLISPVVEGDTTALGRVGFVDLDGDGKLEVIAAPALHRADSGQTVPDGPWHVYHLQSDGTLALLPTTLAFSEEYERLRGTPDSITKTFPSTPGAATLRIVNGVRGIAADSGRVTLNGVEVVSPSEFKKNNRIITIPVQLAATNELVVTLGSKPDAAIRVLIDSAK